MHPTGHRRRARPASAAPALAAALMLVSCAVAPAVREPGVTARTPYPGDILMWDHLLALPGEFDFPADTTGVVLPHHLSDDAEISAVWRGLAAARRPELIVLLSTDHFLAGPADITLPGTVRFETVYGDLAIDRALSRRLAAAPDGLGPAGAASRSLADSPFAAEHGISVHASFLRALFPRSRVLPVLIKSGTSPLALDALARDLRALAPADTLFVASVDFSHYNMVALSRFHDRMAAAAIESMDAERLLGAEVDSPEALFLMTRLMAGRGASRAEVFHRTDLQDKFPYPIADNTSHLYVRYLPGTPAPRPAVTLLVSPSMPAGMEGLAPREPLRSWTWDWRDPERTARLYPDIARLAGAGEEDRAFMGADLYLFGLPDGFAGRWMVGGVRVALVAAGADEASLREAEAALAAERGADLAVAVLDSGSGAGVRDAPGTAASAGVDAAAGRLAEAGADLVVARDPGAAEYREWRLGDSLIVVLPGFLVLPGGARAKRGAERDAAALAAAWTPESLEALPLVLGHEDGAPYLADLPAAKSYHPPPPAEGRE